MDPLTAALAAVAAVLKVVDSVVLYQTLVLQRADVETAKALAQVHLEERKRLLDLSQPFFALINLLKPQAKGPTDEPNDHPR